MYFVSFFIIRYDTWFVLFFNRCFATPQAHITQPAYLHANGHTGGRSNGHVMRGVGLNEYQLETSTPMLSDIPGENEHSDSKVLCLSISLSFYLTISLSVCLSVCLSAR